MGEHLKLNKTLGKYEWSLQQARKFVEKYIHHYNENQFHSAIGYVSSKEKLYERENKIFQQRDNKLEEVSKRRQLNEKMKLRHV